MPYITVGQENSGSIELYYEDHGSGRRLWWPAGPAGTRRLALQPSSEGAVTMRIPRPQLLGQSRAVRGHPSRTKAPHAAVVMNGQGLAGQA